MSLRVAQPHKLTSSLAALLLALVMGLCLTCVGCSTEESGADEPTPEPQYISPYTWENLVFDEGRCYYYKDEVLVSRIGIDVSSHQKNIDWQAVKDDGIEFAFIRLGNRGATEGELYLDEQFTANLEGARQVGMPIGVYFFSQAVDEAEALEEAEFVLAHLEGIELEYPVVFDHEPVTISGTAGRANSITREQLTANAEVFCERIQSAGYRTMLYGNKKDIAKYKPETVESNEIWFAEYDVGIPTGQFDFVMWQYSNTGQVAGIETYVDMNIYFLEA